MLRRTARARSELGDVRAEAGDLPGAIEDYLATVEIYEETNELDAVPYLIWRVLCLSRDLADHNRVVRAYLKATELGLEDVEPLTSGDVHGLVADALAESSDWAAAADC